MDSNFVTAVAAACGSLVGAAATIVTTFITQRTQRVHAEREERLRNHEALYGEFITEASRLTVEALGHALEGPDTLVKLYGISGSAPLSPCSASRQRWMARVVGSSVMKGTPARSRVRDSIAGLVSTRRS